MVKGSKEIGRIERCVIVLMIGFITLGTGGIISFFTPCWWTDTLLLTGLLLVLVGAGGLFITTMNSTKKGCRKEKREDKGGS